MRPTRRARRLLWWAGLVEVLLLAPPLTGAGFQGVTISGHLVAPDDRPLQSGAVVMRPATGETLASHPVDDVQLLPDGAFTFRHVRPGSYQIRARAQTAPNAVTLFGGYRVDVGSRDVTGIHLVLRPGAIVTGAIEVEPGGPGAPDLSSARVRAPFVDGSRFADALTGSIHRDGTFRLAGVMEGDHFVAIDGLPDPWVVTHASWRGADLADLPFTAESGGTVDGVRIVVSTRATEIRGSVRDAAGEPAPNATVFIAPPAFTRWLGGSRRFVRLITDASGAYRHRGLPPGEYRVQAFPEPLLLPPAGASGGTPVRFDAAETREVDVRLGGAAALASAAAR
jgi:hypothetical protein